MHIIVWDPSGDWWEGALCDDATASVLHARDVATLPVEPNLIRTGAAGGYFRRAWGSGWPIGFTTPRMTCPLMMLVSKDLHRLNWCARLVPENEAAAEAIEILNENGQHLTGLLRFAPHTGQPGISAGGYSDDGGSQVVLERLGRPDKYGGWTVGGHARLNGQDGYFACGLYAAVPGLSVAWAAVSQSP